MDSMSVPACLFRSLDKAFSFRILIPLAIECEVNPLLCGLPNFMPCFFFSVNATVRRSVDATPSEGLPFFWRGRGVRSSFGFLSLKNDGDLQ